MQEISNIPPNTVIPCCKIVDSLILLIKENIGPSISKFINTVELLPQPRYSLRTKLLYYLAVPIPYFTVTVISSDQYAIILLTAPIVIHWLSEDCSHWYIIYLFPPLVATTGIFQKAQEKKMLFSVTLSLYVHDRQPASCAYKVPVEIMWNDGWPMYIDEDEHIICINWGAKWRIKLEMFRNRQETSRVK